MVNPVSFNGKIVVKSQNFGVLQSLHNNSVKSDCGYKAVPITPIYQSEDGYYSSILIGGDEFTKINKLDKEIADVVYSPMLQVKTRYKSLMEAHKSARTELWDSFIANPDLTVIANSEKDLDNVMKVLNFLG